MQDSDFIADVAYLLSLVLISRFTRAPPHVLVIPAVRFDVAPVPLWSSQASSTMRHASHIA